MGTNNHTGSWGEQKACEYLIENGYEILARNYRFQHSEIDLIARSNKTLAFIEVKTRSGAGYGFPEEFVSSTKIKLVLKAAENYLFCTDWKYDVRFDIVSILIQPNGQLNFRHIQDAFC